MEQKSYLFYQIGALVLTFILAIVLFVTLLVNNNDPVDYLIIILLFVIIIGDVFGFIIVLSQLISKLKLLQDAITQTDDMASDKLDNNEQKEIRRHHLAEKYVEEVYPILLRNSTNNKDAITSLNTHICNIIGQKDKKCCFDVSFNNDILTFIIYDINDKKLELVYKNKGTEFKTASPDDTYTFSNDVIIRICNNKIERIAKT